MRKKTKISSLGQGIAEVLPQCGYCGEMMSHHILYNSEFWAYSDPARVLVLKVVGSVDCCKLLVTARLHVLDF